MPVSRLLEAHLRQVLALEEAAAERLLSVYAEAERELNDRLAQLDASGQGDTFTAQHLALVRAQLRHAMAVAAENSRVDLGRAFEEAVRLGVRQSHAEIVDLERRFGPDDTARPLASLPLADRIEAAMPVVPAEQVAALADEQTLLLTRFRDGVFTQASRQLSMSVLAGESIGQAGRRLARVMEGNRYQLERIARTEINHAANVGHFHTIQTVGEHFPEMGLKKQWSAHLDARVCPVCRSLHLQVRATNEMFRASNGWTGLFAPCHPNDRCRVMPYSERWEARSVKQIAEEAPGTERNPHLTYAEARAQARSFVRSQAFQDFLDRRPGSHTEVPVAALPDDLAEVIGARARTITLSRETLEKNLRHHPEVPQALYREVQDLLDRAHFIVQDGERTLIAVAQGDRLVYLAVKTTGTGNANFLTSLRYTTAPDLERARRRGRVLRDRNN